MNLEEARQQLINGSGSQFDEEIVSIFIKLIDGTGYGEMLKETAATYE